MKKLFTAIFCQFLAISPALACPIINKIPDFNCDGRVVITVLGDSIAYGIGDTKNSNRGGYVLRAERKLPAVEFNNLSVAGQRTRELLLQLSDIFTSDQFLENKQLLLDSDIVVIDEGRNDRWLFGEPAATYRNLKRAASLIKKKVAEERVIAPLVVTAVLLLPNRGSQGPWVKDLNAIILRSNTLKSPADLRFDLVSKRLLASDQIHPTSVGYDSMAKTFISYLTITLAKKIKLLHPDSNGNDVPDIFEVAPTPIPTATQTPTATATPTQTASATPTLIP